MPEPRFEQFLKPNDPLLCRTAEPVAAEEIGSKALNAEIERLFYVARGEQKEVKTLVGLAAPQIGISKRIILVDVIADGKGAKGDLRLFINPEIIGSSKTEIEWYEGCFSTAQVCGIVSRPDKVRIKALSADGSPIEAEYAGYTARIFQHEIDHLDGHEFVSHIVDDDKLHWVEAEEFPQYRNAEAWRNWPHKCSREVWREIKGLAAYVQHPGKAIETGGRFSHVMAITLDPRSSHRAGLARCIVSREGDVRVKGYVDRSELYLLEGTSLERFELTKRLEIGREREILAGLTKKGWDFIGLEDPDIWIDDASGLMHVYFTIPIKPPTGTEKIEIHLGHAVGEDLSSLEMTQPVLSANDRFSAKEVSIAPLNSRGFRYNLIESRDRRPEATYSVVQAALARDMGGPWEYGKIVFHPKEAGLAWIGGHASPGPLLPRSFINLGPGKMLGIMNGREANRRVEDETIYGMFSVGLFVYDYEKGEIDWVSPEPLIRDTEAETITFASQFVETGRGEGILYAHVDDSFVRAYTLHANGVRALLPPPYHV